ncbi:thioesterase family protein [Mycobacterium sp. ITM-2016-00316]|uniref:thioesterase family protein n=1 Tax=Mycobacterium sp. ITM-2016-00316 TaxID=2099695 RepID=UPI00287FDCB8|nr:thioesterase family protein [Mycobacterium sp. ITM-2016-00316]WNG83446.1 thioesterase family protein [Mycobacterium sp. ITM-2016-00316]
MGGQVVGGLLARAVERHAADSQMQPARLTVDIMRRIALRPIQVDSSVVRTGNRMCAIDAELVQDGHVVARASALYLRRGQHPQPEPWSTPVTMPAAPPERHNWPEDRPMFITCFGRDPAAGGDGTQWKHTGPKYAWVREVRPLVDDEVLTPFVRAAMAADLTSSVANFSVDGLRYINADYTLTLSRLPESALIGLAALTHHGAAGVATGSATLFDARGPIGTGLCTAVANPAFRIPDSFTNSPPESSTAS